MPYYSELSDILNGVVCERFLRNQDLCKLLYCYEPNCNKDCDKCDLCKDHNFLFMNHIYPMPKMPDAKTKKGAYICAYLNGGYEEQENTGYRNVTLNIDIVCNLDIWMVDGKYRAYEIMHQIDMMLNDKLTDLPIVGKPYLRGFQVRIYSEEFHGVQMLYNLKVNSNIECNKQTSMQNLREGLIYDKQWKDCLC